MKPVLMFLVVLATAAVGQDDDLWTGYCGHQALNRCTQPMHVLTENMNLGFATSEKELNMICPILLEGLRCFDNYTLACLRREHKNFFNTLYEGTNLVISELCNPGDRRDEYLRHAPCMHTVQSEYEVCADEYHTHTKQTDMAELAETRKEQVTDLCCSFQRYLNCTQNSLVGRCGNETAVFSQRFLARLSGPLVSGQCLSGRFGPYDCSSAASTGQFISGMMFLVISVGVLRFL